MDAAAKGINTQRKRLGRPPKNPRPTTSDEESIETYNNKNMPDDSAANECRRSSRKKIIKFDVRDLLNKNRKPPKVQIEARIDSNVSSSSSRTNSTSLCHNTAAISTFQHCNIIKRISTLPEFGAKAIISPEQPKRGRGRPPKYRCNETTPIVIKEKTTPVLATSVSVLIKKLELPHGQRFKISGSSFEKINVNELQQTNSMNNEVVVKQQNVSEEENMDETVILDLSDSSIISQTENNENSRESLDTRLLANISNNKLRQRNFAAVSVFNDNAQAETDEFIVAAVEEITTDKSCVDEVQYSKVMENTNYDTENYEEISVEDAQITSDETLILMMDTTSQEGDSSVSIIEFDESDSQLDASIIHDESEHEDIHVIREDDDMVQEIVIRDDSSQDVAEEIILADDDNVDCELAKEQNKLDAYGFNIVSNLEQAYEGDCIEVETSNETLDETDQQNTENEDDQMGNQLQEISNNIVVVDNDDDILNDLDETDSIIEMIVVEELEESNEQKLIVEETTTNSNTEHEEVEVLTMNKVINEVKIAQHEKTKEQDNEEYKSLQQNQESEVDDSQEIFEQNNELNKVEEAFLTRSEDVQNENNEDENENENEKNCAEIKLIAVENENLNKNAESKQKDKKLNINAEAAEVDDYLPKNIESENVKEELRNESADNKKDESYDEDKEHEQFFLEIEQILKSTKDVLRKNENYKLIKNANLENIEKLDQILSNNKEVEEEKNVEKTEINNETKNIEEQLSLEIENENEKSYASENKTQPNTETEDVNMKKITDINKEYEQKVEIKDELIKLQITEELLEPVEILDKNKNKENVVEIDNLDENSMKNELEILISKTEDTSKEMSEETLQNNKEIEKLAITTSEMNEIESIVPDRTNEIHIENEKNAKLKIEEDQEKFKATAEPSEDNEEIEQEQELTYVSEDAEKNQNNEHIEKLCDSDTPDIAVAIECSEENVQEVVHDLSDSATIVAADVNKNSEKHVQEIAAAVVDDKKDTTTAVAAEANKNSEKHVQEIAADVVDDKTDTTTAIAAEANQNNVENVQEIVVEVVHDVSDSATVVAADSNENTEKHVQKIAAEVVDDKEDSVTAVSTEAIKKIENNVQHDIAAEVVHERDSATAVSAKVNKNTEKHVQEIAAEVVDDKEDSVTAVSTEAIKKIENNVQHDIAAEVVHERDSATAVSAEANKNTEKHVQEIAAEVLDDKEDSVTAISTEAIKKIENNVQHDIAAEVVYERDSATAVSAEANKNTEKHVQEIAAEVVHDISVQTSTLLDILRTVKSNEGVIDNQASAEVVLQASAEKQSISPANVQKRRNEKRYCYVVDCMRPKTLEETFAEIAEQSTKVVLEMAAVDKDDLPLPQSSSETVPSNKRRSKSHEKININTNTNIDEQSHRKNQDLAHGNDHDILSNLKCNDGVEVKPSPKRRGRKPKNKDQTADTKLKTTTPGIATDELEEKTVLTKSIPKDNKMEVICEAEEDDVKKTANTHKTPTVEILQENKKTEEQFKKEEETADQIKEEDINIKSDEIKMELDIKAEKIQNTAIENSKPADELMQTDVELLQQQPQLQTPPTIQEETQVVEKKRLKRERKKTRWDVVSAPNTVILQETVPTIITNDEHINKNLRQNQLKAAFQAALTEVSEQQQDTVESDKTTKLDLSDTTLPHMLYKSMAARLDPTLKKSDSVNIDINQCLSADKSENHATDALSDIEKFIADGVSLLKRSHKEEEVAQQEQLQTANIEVEKIVKLNTELNITSNDNSNCLITSLVKTDITHRKTELEMGITFETPADTPVATPTTTPPPKSPNQSYGIAIISNGDETAALRRSHRIKQITKAPKALVGRGLVRDKERFALKDDVELKATYSLDDHLTDLAEVEAKNAKFLKEMEERLSNFQVIKENEYKCERIVSKEARKMICDCFLTAEEEERGELGCGEDCLNRLLMIECGPNCIVKERCTNIRFQKFLCSPCRVFRTEKKGFGIMADVEILPGEFIMEYIGEVIDSDEFENRRTSYSREKNRHYYFMALRSDAFIDATTKGNISRFINHSCDPNAETQKWTVNGELRIGFFSRKSIMPGEEITFDYQYQRYGREAQRCYCESANCRGWIGEEPNSDEGEQHDEETDDDNLAERLLGAEDDDSEESEDDPLEVQKKLEYAAAAAKLTPLLEDINKSDRQRKKLEKLDEEDSTAKFRKLLSKISEKVAKKKQAERSNKSRQRKTRKPAINLVGSPSKSRFLEDPDIEDEVNFLRSCGLKNQSDTLSLSRLMVRSKLPQTRLNLLEVLRQGDEPCRRLFLDYHGLRLLHGWMSEDGNNMDIRLALLQTLMRLPITNKTVLKDSKVLQTVRNWSLSNATTSENNSSPSDESSKESNAVTDSILPDSTTDTNVAVPANDTETEVKQLALKLCGIWDNLQEIFRIPKRERIEQMKEHEREADRQYAADLAGDSQRNENEANQDECQQQRDRFGRGLNRFNRPYSNRERHIPSAFSRRSSYESEDTRHLSKEKRREMFAAKVAREEAEKLLAGERREFDIKCRFFGLDPKRTKPQDMPFCVNTNTGQWFAYGRRPIRTPPNYIHAPRRPKLKSTNVKDYKLPASVATLPKEWRYAITPHGFIYYYHVVYRRPQWEPPNAKQLAACKEFFDSTVECPIESNDDDDDAIKDMEEPQFNVFKDKKVDGRRHKRRNCLVTERPISPRRDEDRLYNQQEVRKYKENKEKIRKRKEEIRRKRAEILKQAAIKAIDDENTRDVDNSLDIGDHVVKTETPDKVATKDEKDEAALPGALPIQEYLLSSDEDDIVADITGNSSLSLFYKIVEGDKIVDEFDALVTNRRAALKRPLPPLREALPPIPQPIPDVVLGNVTSLLPLPTTSSSSNNNTNNNNSNNNNSNNNNNSSNKSSTKRKELSSLERYEQHKRRKLEKKEKEKEKRRHNADGNNSSSSRDADTKLRKLREKFRCDIAGIIVHYLKPYRKSNCTNGRIRSDDDFNHLARKLTHFVMLKEMKYCDSVGQMLVVTESVKNKSRDFIKKYMAKYGEEYEKPANDPEFKEIPFNMKHSHEQKQQPPQPQHLPSLPTLPPLPTVPPLPSTY